MNRIFRFLSSLRFTILLLSILIAEIIPATLITQYQSGEFYLNRFPVLGPFILFSGYDHFFRSLLFLIPAGLFWFNMALCTVKRFRMQLRKKNQHRFGPDILHAGLLILMIAGILSFMTSRKGMVFLGPAQSAALPRGDYLTLLDFEFETYPDGRPSRWASQVVISDKPGDQGDAYTISVNNPLRKNGYIIYQASYQPLENGEGYESGLMLTSDPARGIIFVSLILISIGTIMTFYQKRSDLS